MAAVTLRLARAQAEQAWAPERASPAPLETTRVEAVLAAGRIHALYQANQLDAASQLFEQMQRTIAGCGIADFIALAYLAMVRVHDARAQPAQAQALLCELRRIARLAQLPRLLALLEWERVRRALLCGDPVQAAAIAALIAPGEGVGAPLPGPAFSAELDSPAIGHIRLMIHQGRLQPAIALLVQQQRAAETQAPLCQRIKLQLLEALAQHYSGNELQGRRSLQRAAQMAEVGRLPRLLLDEGETVIELLIEELSQMAAEIDEGAIRIRCFIEASLGAAGRCAARPLPAASLIEPLTERELDVLVHLTHGASNRIIADAIHIGENTVKYHLKNVFAKLQVRSRLEAICKARRLGLL